MFHIFFFHFQVLNLTSGINGIKPEINGITLRIEPGINGITLRINGIKLPGPLGSKQ